MPRRPGELPNDPDPDPNPDPPNPDPPPAPVRTPGQERRSHVAPKSIECEFCDCQITTMEGRILKYSKKAKELRDSAESLERLHAEIENLKRENQELRAKIQPVNPSPEKKKTGWEF